MKRFTATEKWSDKWFRSLPRDVKLAFYYVIENCDSAGVWEADYDLANFCIGGEPLDWDAVLIALGDKAHVMPNGKWFLTKFIEFQYGKLSEDCKPHLSVIRTLQNHGIIIGYQKGIQTVTFAKGKLTLEEKEKEKDKEKDKGKGLGGEIGALVELPLQQQMPAILDNADFRGAWQDWLAYRSQRKLPKLVPKSVDAQLRKLADYGSAGAIASIRQSIEQNYQGLFAPKNMPAEHADMPRLGVNLK